MPSPQPRRGGRSAVPSHDFGEREYDIKRLDWSGSGKTTIYIETTIISYLAARLSRDLLVAAHQQLTVEWWTDRRQEFEVFSSELVAIEVAAGDQATARKRLDFLAEIPFLPTTEASLTLA